MSVMHGDFISDGGVLWRAEDTRLYGYVADIPNFYDRESLFEMNTERTRIITPTRLLVNINNHGYIAEESYILNINSTAYYDVTSVSMATPANRAGKDIYIYAIEADDAEVPGFILSINSTVPTGYTSRNSRKIGGFHCLCESVGAIAGHPYSGYERGNIIPLSIWDLKHRPVSDPEGMVWVKGINKWVDIYLNSWNGFELVSAFNGVIADGTENNGQSWNGEKFAEFLGKIGKSLPTRDEFLVFAKQSNERTSITGTSDPVTTGGHMDSRSLRMISNYAIEDCCGAMFQWCKDTHEFTPNATWNVEETSLNDYSWTISSVFNDVVDNINYGQYYGLLRRTYVGGAWNTTICSGSRCGAADLLSATPSDMIGCRGVSDPK